MARHHYLQAGVLSLVVVIMLLATPVQSRTTTQFQQFFPTWDAPLGASRDRNCTQQRDEYNDPTNNDPLAAFKLATCLLNDMPEFKKTEMSIVSVVFGLLPSVLMLIGPTTGEITLLARRRPLLAVLLSVAMPAIRFSEKSPYREPAAYLRQPVELSARPGPLAKSTVWARVLVAAVEYLLAAGAASAMCFQCYSLALHCITVSTIAVYSGPLPQTYGPFLWILLILTVHALGVAAWVLRYQQDPERPLPPGGPSPFARLRRGFVQELTPCCYGDPVFLQQRPKTYTYATLTQLSRLGVVVLFLYGTIILSSQIFISLGDAVPLIAAIMLGAYVSRLLLAFELYGMKEVTSLAELDVLAEGGSLVDKGRSLKLLL